MTKRKVDSADSALTQSGNKKIKQSEGVTKASMLDGSDASTSDDSDGGAKLEDGFKINGEFAKRFEHNKKREEIQKLDEKYLKTTKRANGQYGDKYDEDTESSNDESEDDEGFLATEDLDAEISATLQAIRTKDPRVYDEKVTFYKPVDEDVETPSVQKEKPMYLADYHRRNLLAGNAGVEDEEPAPRTFAQEQEDLKKIVVKEMHAAVEESSEDENGGFLVPKSKPEPARVHPSRTKSSVNLDVESADKDPETFLSNFMTARAWVPSEGVSFQPFESDDEGDDERAEKFEAAYNLRFEDPAGSNEMLKSYARDVIAAKSVRREEPNSRKKQRDAQREKREADRRDREEERSRLRKLKIEEMGDKLQKIKKAAGMKGKTLQNEDWMKFLEENWDDDSWEREMNKRFGDDYYAEQEIGSDGDTGRGKKVKKPKWDDDIEIGDLIPDFDNETQKLAFTLSDEDETDSLSKPKTSKDRLQATQARRKAARLERAKLEEIVDNHLDLDLPSSSMQPRKFKYRDTSPVSFGLTARDILLAPDSSLNQFAGLKKMAAFRDAEKKRKDKKHLGKKARLRQWRKETFGNEDGPVLSVGGDAVGGASELRGQIMESEEKKKKRRSRKTKERKSSDM